MVLKSLKMSKSNILETVCFGENKYITAVACRKSSEKEFRYYLRFDKQIKEKKTLIGPTLNKNNTFVIKDDEFELLMAKMYNKKPFCIEKNGKMFEFSEKDGLYRLDLKYVRSKYQYRCDKHIEFNGRELDVLLDLSDQLQESIEFDICEKIGEIIYPILEELYNSRNKNSNKDCSLNKKC